MQMKFRATRPSRASERSVLIIWTERSSSSSTWRRKRARRPPNLSKFPSLTIKGERIYFLLNRLIHFLLHGVNTMPNFILYRTDSDDGDAEKKKFKSQLQGTFCVKQTLLKKPQQEKKNMDFHTSQVLLSWRNPTLSGTMLLVWKEPKRPLKKRSSCQSNSLIFSLVW